MGDWSAKQISDVKVGDEVIGLPDAGPKHRRKLKPTLVKQIHSNGVQQIVKIELEDGSSLKCTSDHMVYVHNGYELRWVAAGNIKPGHSIPKISENREIERDSYVKVESVTMCGRSNVYDLTTDSHNYVCGGMVVHNCDTEFSTGTNMSICDIHNKVDNLQLQNHNGKPLVVITGGEPLIWFGITDLVDGLLEKGYAVQVETCGAVYNSELPWLNAFFFVVCSPKTAKLNPNIEMNADAFKYIITHGEVSDADGLPNKSTQIKGQDCILARPPESVPVYLTPCDPHENDEEYKKNIDEAVSSCLKFGYTLNLQLHKVVGLP